MIALTPQVVARKVGRHLVVICPHCQEDHRHGAGGGYGHRLAHCYPRRGAGYYLIPDDGDA